MERPAPDGPPRPGPVCRALLDALEASEGRRRRRKRDQRPDAIGLAIKRELLERAADADPPPEAFEGWLLEQCLEARGPHPLGAVRAMAIQIFHEWRLAAAIGDFERWLASGAPSEDRADGDASTSGAPPAGPPIATPLPTSADFPGAREEAA